MAWFGDVILGYCVGAAELIPVGNPIWPALQGKIMDYHQLCQANYCYFKLYYRNLKIFYFFRERGLRVFDCKTRTSFTGGAEALFGTQIRLLGRRFQSFICINYRDC